MTARSWAVASLVSGLLLVHVSWILAVPPYRGIDEFDHVYRAASLAHGQLRPYSEAVADGRGDYVRVPERIVTDAQEVCDSYEYVGRDNCFAVKELDAGFVKVASAAADYNPAYYAVVGSIARYWDGSNFVYAGRFVTALIVVALWGLAALAASTARRPRAALLGLGLAATPVLTYSGAILAPNGLEMASAAALWTSLLVVKDQRSSAQERLIILVAVVCACILATVRTLGPFWLACIVATVLFLPGRGARLAALRRHPRLLLAGVVATAASSLLSVWWVLSAGTNQVQQDGDTLYGEPWQSTLIQVPLWVFQSVAAFPTRGEQAPGVVYGLVLAVLTLVLFAFGARSGLRWWLVLAGMVAVWLVPPWLFTLHTYEVAGAIWQGRYSLPYSVGIIVVLLVGVSRRSDLLPLRALTSIAGIAYALAVAVSIANVRQREIAESPLSGDDRWVTLPLWLTVGMAGLGTILVFAAVLRFNSDQHIPVGDSRPLVEAKT